MVMRVAVRALCRQSRVPFLSTDLIHSIHSNVFRLCCWLMHRRDHRHRFIELLTRLFRLEAPWFHPSCPTTSPLTPLTTTIATAITNAVTRTIIVASTPRPVILIALVCCLRLVPLLRCQHSSRLTSHHILWLSTAHRHCVRFHLQYHPPRRPQLSDHDSMA